MPKAWTEEQFLEKFEKGKDNNIILLGRFKNTSTMIPVKCKTCEEEWTADPRRLINGSGCMRCKGLVRKTHEQFVQDVKDKYGDEYTILTEYTGNKNKIRIRHNCPDCDYYIFEKVPNKFLNFEQTCNVCSQKEKESKNVRRIKKHLEKEGIIYETEKIYETCKRHNYLPFDFYLPELDILIEYDGEFHFRGWDADPERLKIQQDCDNFKNNWCKENNKTLYRIAYNDKIITKLKNIIKAHTKND